MWGVCFVTIFFAVLEMVSVKTAGAPICVMMAAIEFAKYDTQPHPKANITALENCKESPYLYGRCTEGSYSGHPSTTTQIHYYKVTVPAGAGLVVFSTSGGAGSLQLYVRKNGLPASPLGLHDYKDDSSIGTTRVITEMNPPAGDYYALLRPSDKFERVQFKACFCGGGNSTSGNGGGGCCGEDLEPNLYYVVGAATALILLILIILILIVCCCLSCKIDHHHSE